MYFIAFAPMSFCSPMTFCRFETSSGHRICRSVLRRCRKTVLGEGQSPLRHLRVSQIEFSIPRVFLHSDRDKPCLPRIGVWAGRSQSDAEISTLSFLRRALTILYC